MNYTCNAFLFPKQYYDFVNAFKETALWASIDDKGIPLDDGKYDGYTWHKEADRRIDNDCMKFFNMAYPIIREDVCQAAHDFFLTRNGHGAGFWDGEWKFPFEESDIYIKDCGDFLTAATKKYGELHIYTYRRKFRID